MTKLTAKKVRDYMSYRTSEGIRHCPEELDTTEPDHHKPQ